MKVKIRKLRDQDSNCCLPLGPCLPLGMLTHEIRKQPAWNCDLRMRFTHQDIADTKTAGMELRSSDEYARQ